MTELIVCLPKCSFLLNLLGVQYYTGQKFDMKTITDAGHKKVHLIFPFSQLSIFYIAFST